MRSWVILKNGKLDNIPDYMVGGMIDTGEVTLIKRYTGWAKIGFDPIRKGESKYYYYGPERREQDQKRLCFACPNLFVRECTSQICHKRYLGFKEYTK